jgi:hypothetical protein
LAKVALVHLEPTDQVDNIGEAVRATASDVEGEIRDMRADEAMTRGAVKLIASGRNDAYEVAMAALHEGTRDWWADVLARDRDELDEGEEPATADSGPAARNDRGLICLAKSGRGRGSIRRISWRVLKARAFAGRHSPERLVLRSAPEAIGLHSCQHCFLT